jgi:hypothetical protein
MSLNSPDDATSIAAYALSQLLNIHRLLKAQQRTLTSPVSLRMFPLVTPSTFVARGSSSVSSRVLVRAPLPKPLLCLPASLKNLAFQLAHDDQAAGHPGRWLKPW